MSRLPCLPCEIYAEIACYLPGPDGAICRMMAGKCVIRETRIYKYIAWQDLAFSPHGTIRCTYKNGQLHSFNDLPAYCIDGREIWFDCGIMHRDGDQPALVDRKGLKKYVIHGKLHRDAGPAYYDNEKTIWYTNGLIHSDTGPAYYGNGKTMWYKNGKIHNDTGPAILYAGYAEYWEHGQPIRHITMIYKAFVGWLTGTVNVSHEYFKTRPCD